MPNGGTDNCMNCPHNRANQTPANIKTALRDTRIAFCMVHKIPIESRAWTYCGNILRETPDINLAINTIGLADEGYDRIPWFGLSPVMTDWVIERCEICGKSTDKGISVNRPSLHVQASFCCNEHYRTWYERQQKEFDHDDLYQYDRSPLQNLILQGEMTKIEQAIDNDLDLDHRDRAGWTALHMAAYLGHESIVDLLLQKGANALVREFNGLKPVDLAGSEGHTNIVARLLSASYLDLASQEDALLKAAAGGNLEVVEALVRNGTNIECKDYRGRTPLFFAIWEGHLTTATFLLDHGADVRVEDDYGNTPLKTVDTWSANSSNELKTLVRQWLAK